jgi:multiple sugar transport system substrate-binding protein
MKRSTRRFGLGVAALATASALLLSGCSAGGGADANGVTNVKMVLWPGPEGDAMQKVVDAYNADPGVTDKVNVEMVLLSRDDTFARETTEIGSQSSEVDIYFVATYNVGYFQGGLDPLTDVAVDDSNYFDTAISGLTIDDQLYALPLDVSNHFLYYRTDLMDQLLSDPAWKAEYGKVSADVLGEAREPKAPEDWDIDDYHAAAAFFSQSANPDSPTKYGTALQLKTSPFNTTLWDDLLWGLGGNWEEDGKASLDSPEAKKATEVYADIYKNGYTSPDSSQAEYAETNAALQGGSAAFALQWSSAYAELTDPESSPDIADKIAVAPIPGDPHQTHVHSLAIGLNKYSNNKDAATTWMSYLATPEAMDAYAKAGGIPSMPDVLAANADINPAFPLISDQVAQYGYTPPIFAGTFEAMTSIVETLNPAWLGIEDPDQALKEANDGLQGLLDE